MSSAAVAESLNENEYGSTNLFQLAIADVLADHKMNCALVSGKCRTCKLDIEDIQNWDKNHR